MENRGKLLILFIFGTALALSIFAWSFQYLRGRRVLELYGADAARLIRVDADRVELLVIDQSATKPIDSLSIDKVAFFVVRIVDITKARGLIHARQALIEDSSYEWDRPNRDCTRIVTYALRFSHGDKTATTLIDTGCRQLRLVETKAEAPLAEHFVTGMQKFVDEQLLKPQRDGEPPAEPMSRNDE